MNWFKVNLEKIVYFSFLVPIITVAVVSISHVTGWYGLTNNSTWAIYLSFGVEIAALSALAAISVQMGKNVYIPFGIVTLIQFVGNVFYSYQYIDDKSDSFIKWVELSNVFFQYLIDENDIIGHKRLLSLFSGGLLPIISLTFLHMLVKLQESKNNEKMVNIDSETIEALSYDAGKIERIQDETKDKINPTEDELSKLEAYLNNLMVTKNNITPDVTTKGRKKSVNVTPTPLEKSLFFSDEVISETPKPTRAKPGRKKKIELVVPELNEDKEYNGEIKKLVYKNRNAENS
jgi:hypothetical protein